MTSLSVQSVPTVASDVTAPIETEAPTIVSGTFNITRTN